MSELKYLETYGSENTVRTYKQALKVFLSNIYGDGELTDLAKRYFQETRDHKTDIQNFLAKINGRPPKTIRLYISAVRTFLMENDIELPEKFWRSLTRKIKGSMARTMDKIPSNVQLRRIIMHMPVHGKALYLTLASSGMRIGEALQLELDDIDLDNDPPKISIRGEYTKSGDPRYTFISGETKEHILEWLKYRTEYLKSASKRSRHGKSTEDTRLFPFGMSNAHFIWKNALDKTKLNSVDKSTKRHQFHPHVLRKFFRTRMGPVISVDITEALMGHKGYLTDIYRRYDEDKLAEFYKKGETAVAVFGKVEDALMKADVTKLENRILELNREVADLKDNWRKLKDFTVDLTSMTPEELQILAKLAQEMLRKQIKEADRDEQERQRKHAYAEEEREAWREQKMKEK